MKKSYSDLWSELKKWLDSGEGSLEEIIRKTKDTNEIERLKIKQDTFLIVHNKMKELEK